MLLKVIDASGATQTVITKGQESPVDHSGIIANTGQSQLLMDANNFRSGFLFQNVGANPMWLNDTGADANTQFGNWLVAPGESVSSENFPVSTLKWTIRGTVNDGFTMREW
jgi:hypothetical protein